MATIENGTRRVGGILFLTLFLDLVGFSIIFPLFPAILDHYLERDGGAGVIGQIAALLQDWTGADSAADWRVQALFGGLLGSLYAFLQFLFAPVWGRLSDRHGRRPILLITVAGLALAHLLWIFSASFELFLLARVLGGIMSGNISTATAAMADTTSEADRARGMGIIGAAFGLGFILGPAIGGLLAGWQPGTAPAGAWGLHPFSIPAAGALVLGIINLAWVAARFPETLPPGRRGEVRTDRRTANLLALFDAGLGRAVRRTNLAYLLFIVAFSGMEFTLTFLVRDRLQWGPGAIAILLSVAGVIIAFIQGGAVRPLVRRLGERTVARAGLILVIPGLLVLAVAESGALVYAGLVPMAIGSALAIPTLTALASLYAPADRQGAALGTFRSVGSLGRAIGPIAAAVAYGQYGRAVPYVAGSLLLVLPIIMAFQLPAPVSRAEPEPAASGS